MLTYWRTVEGREARRVEGAAVVLELPNWTHLETVAPVSSFAWSCDGTRGHGAFSTIAEGTRADTLPPGAVAAIRAGNGWELAFRAG